MTKNKTEQSKKPAAAKPSALLDTRVIYCGDNLDQLAKLPDRSVDLIYIDPPFNSNLGPQRLYLWQTCLSNPFPSATNHFLTAPS